MDLYREEVLDHYKNPRNKGALEGADYQITDSNASCGDMLEFYLNVEDGVVRRVGWKGVGCAISTASASKFSEWLIGKKLIEVNKTDPDDLASEAIGFEVSEGRKKCLMLSIRAIGKINGL